MAVRMLRWLGGAAALAFLPGIAHAAGPCSMPPALQVRVCADPDLAKLDAELVAKEKAVQAVTMRPATWAARAAEFRAYTATEADLDGKLVGKDDLASRIQGEIAQLDVELGQAGGIRTPATEAAALGDACLAGWLSMGCKVPASGILREGGTKILWQLQSGASEEDGGGMGAMLWDASGGGAPKPIGWTFEGVWMQAPRFNPENGLLWVSGTRGGTGDGNADLLYQKRGDRWVEIELVSWRADLDKRLPKGLGAWHGVDYDLVNLGARTDLWRDKDANCCATGGRASLAFTIEGDSLKLTGLSIQQGGPDKEWKDF